MIFKKFLKEVFCMKKIDKPCIAFKLNYCDGGKNSERIGFYGICSDSVIKYNIKIKNRRWCSNEDCACRQYFDEKISRDDLEENWDEEIGSNYFSCLESQAFRDWYFNAGNNSDGKPRPIRGAKNGHLCIFTTVVSHLNTNFVDNNKQICYFIRDRLMMQE